jgi:RHS repeat-associated protein
MGLDGGTPAWRKGSGWSFPGPASRDNPLAPFTGTQAFTYDDDGNLLSDGLWTYLWDAENRLVRMTSALPSGQGYTRLELNFKYDYLGRRVEKKVENLDGPQPNFTRRYLYDGWNLVLEFSVSGSTLGLVRSYTWGLDITADLTKAGGVGALLQIHDYAQNKQFLPGYDGNGNIVALFDAATSGGSAGACVAAYEYSPFGEFLRSEGTYATDNPFRFSTKFTDDESGLVYYGRRYYSPSKGRFLGRDRAARRLHPRAKRADEQRAHRTVYARAGQGAGIHGRGEL